MTSVPQSNSSELSTLHRTDLGMASEEDLGPSHVSLSTVCLRGDCSECCVGTQALSPPTRPWTNVTWASGLRRPGRWETRPRMGVLSALPREEGDTSVRPLHTFSSMRTGTTPKKGLIAMPGRISAPSSEGRGAMQMPPVSVVGKGRQGRNTSGLSR